jgi:exonuclease III
MTFYGHMTSIYFISKRLPSPTLATPSATRHIRTWGRIYEVRLSWYETGIQLDNVTKLASGRGLAAVCGVIMLINIYAPSGAAKQKEREHFYNTDLAYLLRDAPANILLGEISIVC